MNAVCALCCCCFCCRPSCCCWRTRCTMLISPRTLKATNEHAQGARAHHAFSARDTGVWVLFCVYFSVRVRVNVVETSGETFFVFGIRRSSRCVYTLHTSSIEHTLNALAHNVRNNLKHISSNGDDDDDDPGDGALSDAYRFVRIASDPNLANSYYNFGMKCVWT